MKQNAHYTAGALALAGGLLLAGSAQAQSVTGTPYLSNIDPSTLNTSPNATYASWNAASSSTPVTFNSLSTGLEVSAATYGSLYYVVPNANVQTLNPLDTEATLTFTVNSPSVANIYWIGTPFILGDNTGAVTYGGYSTAGNPGSNPLTTVTWNGNVVTETQPLSAAQLAAVQAGNDAIYSFNLETDPASFNGPPIYDITFNSLVLSPAATPEPTSLALVALGAAGFVISRRRK